MVRNILVMAEVIAMTEIDLAPRNYPKHPQLEREWESLEDLKGDLQARLMLLSQSCAVLDHSLRWVS